MFDPKASDSPQSPSRSRRLDDIADLPGREPRQVGALDLLALIPLTEAHRHLPRRAAGKKIHRTTLGRWCSKGCRGRVLRTWLVGGIRYTSLEAIAEFVRQSAAPAPPAGGSMPSPPHSPTPAGIPATTPARVGRPSTRRDRIEQDLKRFGL